VRYAQQIFHGAVHVPGISGNGLSVEAGCATLEVTPSEGLIVFLDRGQRDEFAFTDYVVAPGVQRQVHAKQENTLHLFFKPVEARAHVGRYEFAHFMAYRGDLFPEKVFLALEVFIEGTHRQVGRVGYLVDVYGVEATLAKQPLTCLHEPLTARFPEAYGRRCDGDVEDPLAVPVQSWKSPVRHDISQGGG